MAYNQRSKVSRYCLWTEPLEVLLGTSDGLQTLATFFTSTEACNACKALMAHGFLTGTFSFQVRSKKKSTEEHKKVPKLCKGHRS